MSGQNAIAIFNQLAYDYLDMLQWKPVIGYEGLYEVSNTGMIRSLPRKMTKGRILSQSWRGRYLCVDLSKDGYRKSFNVARVVAVAWCPNPHNKPQVNHKNAIRGSNHYKNLEWMTAKENTEHAIRSGLRTIRRGEDAGQSKLIDLQVKEIYRMGKIGMRTREIAEHFNVSHQTISDILRGKKWKHLFHLAA